MNHRASGSGGRAGAGSSPASGPGTVDYVMVDREALAGALESVAALVVALQVAVRDGFTARETVTDLQQLLEAIDRVGGEL